MLVHQGALTFSSQALQEGMQPEPRMTGSEYTKGAFVPSEKYPCRIIDLKCLRLET